MNKYEDVKKYIDKNSNKCADDFENIEDYHLMIRISQMYRELEQLKLSYKKVLEEDFKCTLLRNVSQARQTLYNTRDIRFRKQDLIDSIDYAIKDLDKILVLKEVE